MKLCIHRNLQWFFALFLSMCVANFAIAAPKSSIRVSSEDEAKVLPIDDIQRFSAAIGQIKKFYVEPVDDQELFENAIRGMLSGLDPHSTYLDKEEYAELRSHTAGEFGGLGIEVGMEDGYIKVISPIDDTPAEKKGVKAGDLIIRLDDSPVKGMTLREAVNKMRGKVGTDIKLTIIRKNETKPVYITVTRDIIKVQSVKSELLEKGYGYVRVSHFQTPTGTDLNKHIKKLIKENNGPLKGLVLDLRNNPGGLLDSAIDVSDTFLDSKQLDNDLIVFTKGRIPGAQYNAKAKPGDVMKGAPMVVLINEGSASGSEIVAGALQDHQRAIIMGTATFGKGSVQTVLPLDDTRGVKLTTALYYTPNGRSIQAKGIQPDILVTDMDVTQDPNSDYSFAILKEADLDNHLVNENGEPEKKQASNEDKKDNENNKPLAVKDYQLHEALNLLKGLSVANNRTQK